MSKSSGGENGSGSSRLGNKRKVEHKEQENSKIVKLDENRPLTLIEM